MIDNPATGTLSTFAITGATATVSINIANAKTATATFFILFHPLLH
jgi:hypothetical protein